MERLNLLTHLRTVALHPLFCEFLLMLNNTSTNCPAKIFKLFKADMLFSFTTASAATTFPSGEVPHLLSLSIQPHLGLVSHVHSTFLR